MPTYDLEERTAKFGEEIIKFYQKVHVTSATAPLISQGVRAGTSVGANYCEAQEAETKKDFTHKIGICKKEVKECKYWLRMTVVAVPAMKEEARKLWKEAHELNLIFAKIVRSSRSKP